MKELRPLELPKTGYFFGVLGLDEPSDLGGVGVRVVEDGPALHEGVHAQGHGGEGQEEEGGMSDQGAHVRLRIGSR
jgi:hypothetical protein